MKKGLLLALPLIFHTVGFAQQAAPTQPGVQNAQVQGMEVTDRGQQITTLLVENFDRPDEWSAYISPDVGRAKLTRRPGRPAALVAPAGANTEPRFVLGVRVDFTRRVWTPIEIKPPVPVQIKGLTETMMVWAVGRATRHTLSFMVRDLMGRPFTLEAEPMTWVGWKQTSARVPASVIQEDYRINANKGLTFEGFVINTEAMDVYLGAPFYIYLDEFTTRTDIYGVYGQLADDMRDTW